MDEFENKIGRLTKSKAYLDYCEEVYGYRIYLFNMMDQEQLDFIINSVPLSAQDTLLDLGCGSGSLLSLLADKYGCRGIGIDQLPGDVTDKSITYINGDIDQISGYRLNPTVVLSVDSLYFSKDLDGLLRQLCDFHGSRLYLFYSQYLFDETAGDRSSLHCDHTKVADGLKRIGISYKAVNYSENERLLYEKSLKALQKRSSAFMDEGNLDLFEAKLKEDTLGKQLYDNGLASRYLYIISAE
jgi:SAM-dependent methyltransferase